MNGFTSSTNEEPSASETNTSSLLPRRSQIYSEVDTSKSLDVYSNQHSLNSNFTSGHTDHSEATRKAQLEKLNQQILAEYEGVRHSVVISQQNYRATVDKFLTFASENKQIYSRISDLYERVSKEYDACSTEQYGYFAAHLRLVVNISLLYFRNTETSSSMANLLIRTPHLALHAFQDAIQEIWKAQNTKLNLPLPKLGICGWLGRNHVTPRGLNSCMINNLVAVEGVVNKCSTVVPKLSCLVSVGEVLVDLMNEMEKSVHLRQFYDLTDLTKTLKDSGNPPPTDPEGKIVHRQEIGLSNYRNYQTFVVQETPEDSHTGQMPRYISVIVQDDLCNVVKCGDRVRVWGVYRAGCGRADDSNNGIARGYLVANYLIIKDKISLRMLHDITPEDRSKFKALANHPDALNILTRSIAPSICGLEAVKRGIILQLVGGPQVEDGAEHRIRGDIHVLLVGDPGCGKSQLLRFVMNLLPNTISTTGRGSTGVGLTAAVLYDQETGERHVEGGAMVLGDRRIVVIDEFDKMAHSDRVAIHEVLEQQTVTVAKAGIHTTLNARCTVLAAANPIYGCWSEDLHVSQQLNFEPSLLSRFDLIYVVRDSTTEQLDDRIADAVLRNITQKSKVLKTSFLGTKGMNTTGAGGGCHSTVVQPLQDDMNQIALANFKINGNMVTDDFNNFYTPTRSTRGRKSRASTTQSPNAAYSDLFKNRSEMSYTDTMGRDWDVLDTVALRKYIHYCKYLYYREMESQEGWKPCPEISDLARRQIVLLYSQLRERAKQFESQSRKLPQAVTPRTLEAIVRLAVAYARLKLQRWVTKEIVDHVGELLNFTLFGDAYNPLKIVGAGKADDEAYIPSDEEEYDLTMDDSVKRTRTAFSNNQKPSSPIRAVDAASQKETIIVQANDKAISVTPSGKQQIVTVLLDCLKRLDTGDGVNINTLHLEFTKLVKMSYQEFEQLLDELHNTEPSPIVYAPEEFRVFSC